MKYLISVVQSKKKKKKNHNAKTTEIEKKLTDHNDDKYIAT